MEIQERDPAKEISLQTAAALLNLTISQVDINMIYFNNGAALELTNWQVDYLHAITDKLRQRPAKNGKSGRKCAVSYFFAYIRKAIMG